MIPPPFSTVGVISHEATLQLPSPHPCHLVELRLDNLPLTPNLLNFIKQSAQPLILTTRRPDEGGLTPSLTDQQRADIFQESLLSPLPDPTFTKAPSWIDLELRSLPAMTTTWELAKEKGLKRIASWHSFDRLPELDELIALTHQAARAEADLAKFAFLLPTHQDISLGAELLATPDLPIPLAVMGMGSFAAASRLLYAQLGSRLNYGYLGDQPTAPGQLPSSLLLQTLTHLNKQ